MVVKTHEDTVLKDAEDTEYQFTRKAGRHIVKHKPVFSPDKKYLLVCVDNVVRVYNVLTGDIVRTLETEIHSQELIGIAFTASDKYGFLYGCSENGCITTWTYESGGVLREVNLDFGTDQKVYSFELLNDEEAFVTHAKEYDKNFTFTSFNVRTGKIVIRYNGYPVAKTSILCVSLGYCDGDRYAAICNGTKSLFVQNLEQPHLKLQLFNANQLRIISVAAHPRDSSLAITDTLGRVTIVKGYLYEHRNIAKEVMHWHYLPVFAAAFSKEGSYLYTGGMEKVLVKWSVGHIASKAQEKQFIVRLPGYVRHIAVSDTVVALALSNNSLVIASTQMKVEMTIQECGGLSPAARALGAALAYHRPSDCLLLGGRSGHLQMYSTASDKLLFNLDITETNSLPPTRHNLVPLESEVACAAAAAAGAWLVTSQYRNDGVMYPEEQLKFWLQHDDPACPFKLNTCVNLSHNGCQVVSLALSNKGDICVSAGKDNKFRVWKLDANKEGNKTLYSWSCLTACYYSSGFAQSTAQEILNGFKNSEFNKAGKMDDLTYLTEDLGERDVVRNIMDINKDTHFVEIQKEKLCSEDSEMGSVALSADGSLTAAVFGGKGTVWDTARGALRAALAHSALRPRVTHLAFGSHDAAHYLVCTTEDCLAVWSLLSLTIKWFVNMRPTCLAADPFTNRMAVITENNEVFVFRPQSARPLLQRAGPAAGAGGAGSFSHCAFAAAPPGRVRLYMMRNDCEIFCLEPSRTGAALAPLESPGAGAGRAQAAPPSAFGALLAGRARSDVRGVARADLAYTDTDRLGKTAFQQFLSAASHMMPPVSLVSAAFLEHMSGKRQPAEDGAEPGHADLDEGSSDEEDAPAKDVRVQAEMWAANYEAADESKLKKIAKRDLANSVKKTLFK